MFVLTIVGITILGWVLFEVTTTLVAMGATFLAIFPIKAAVRRFLALESERERLLERLNEEVADDVYGHPKTVLPRGSF